MGVNPASWVAGWARQAPQAPALEAGTTRLTYGELDVRVAALAGSLLASGIGSGQRVAWLGHNSIAYLVLVLAAARIGAIMVPLNWRLAAAELGAILADAAPSLLVHEEEFTGLAAPFGGPRAPAGPLDLAMPPAAGPGPAPVAGGDFIIIYTSGTTGRPKGVLLSQENIFWGALNSVHAHDFVAADRVLANLPMFHAGGLHLQTLPALHCGAALLIQPRFNPADTLAAIAAWRPTLHVSVPSALQQLAEHPAFAATDFSSLRLVMTGSAAVPEGLLRAFLSRGVALGQIYGATETTGGVVYTRRADFEAGFGTAGRPAVHAEVALLDGQGSPVQAGAEGQIAVRGPSVFAGYWRQPEATRAAFRDGWYLTGDAGRFDQHGFLRIADRIKDMLITGGYNVYPAEIEAVLRQHPAIADIAVVGRPDAKWGEVAVAFVVPRTGQRIEAGAIRAFAAERLARYKVPAEIRVVDELPRNALGKVLKRDLASRAADAAGR